MVRTLRSALEFNISAKIPIDHPIIPWLVRHAGLNIARYQIRDDGITSLHKMKGYKGIMPTCEFGEVIHFRPHDILKQSCYNDRYENGISLCFVSRSGENIVGTERRPPHRVDATKVAGLPMESRARGQHCGHA